MTIRGYTALTFLITAFILLSETFQLRDISPHKKFLYEYEDSLLEVRSKEIFRKAKNITVDRRWTGELANELFMNSIDYLVLKYDLYGELDTLRFSRFLIDDLHSSSYFGERLDNWTDDELKNYINFRIEWDIIKYYRQKFVLEEFSDTDLYFDLRNRLIKDGLDPSGLDKVLSSVTEVNVTPLHFYYKPKSIEIQMKTDKFDIKKFNMYEMIEFYKQHREALEKAEREYNVNGEIIVAILRKETNLGRYPLSYRIMEVLLGQALFGIRNPMIPDEENDNSPERIARLRRSAEKSLYNIVKFCVENGNDPASIKSNFVGAIGAPQFMPFNLHLARDGDGDGIADLSNLDDAIVSIAHYLNDRGWTQYYALDRLNKRVIEKFIGTYNKSETYTEAVFELAYELKKRLEK